MTQLLICEWQTSTFETDSDGEDYTSSESVGYTEHDSYLSAIACAEKGYIGYGLETGKITDPEDENYWEPVYCDAILVYENNALIGKYNLMSMDEWRFYEVMDHWKSMYSHQITYPPALYDEGKKALDDLYDED